MKWILYKILFLFFWIILSFHTLAQERHQPDSLEMDSLIHQIEKLNSLNLSSFDELWVINDDREDPHHNGIFRTMRMGWFISDSGDYWVLVISKGKTFDGIGAYKGKRG